MNKDLTPHQKPAPQNPTKSFSSENPSFKDSDSSDIDESQVQKTLVLLQKLKRIEKRGGLSRFKSKRRVNNTLFQHMSEFFHQKQKRILAQKARIVEQRTAISKRRFEATVNSLSAPSFTAPQEGRTEEDHNQSQLQQVQPDLPHPYLPKISVSCHICLKPYTEIHSFYGSLCPECAAFNWSKRSQRVDMTGLTALVTGARIKIGYEIAVRLLREGATVYATSRFPRDTVLRYKKQVDYEQWKNRLFVMQCDFLSQAQVTALIAHVQHNVKKLDILINNAAQTIVRPQEFYALEMKREQMAVEGQEDRVIGTALEVIKENQQQLPSLYPQQHVPVLPGQIDTSHLDEFGQPTDKRSTNSWVQKLQDVSLLDCYTTQVINAIVPFHLIGQLKSKLIGETPSWVINVSSMEGVFYRANKQHYHPHTNMAKAALNMLTRTSAPEFKDQGIFMNAVDTGWVTNENPYPVAQKMTKEHRFKCPLDCVDGAMRVLDPIYLGLLSKQFPYGQFLKNYKPSNW